MSATSSITAAEANGAASSPSTTVTNGSSSVCLKEQCSYCDQMNKRLLELRYALTEPEMPRGRCTFVRPVEFRDEENVFFGKRLVTKTLTVRHGNKSEEWEIVHRIQKPKTPCHGVYVIPILKRAGRPTVILLEKQYRVPMDGFVIEFPGGFMQPGETPAMCARRELLEETGYAANKVLSVSPFICTEGAAVMFNTCAFVTLLIDGDAPENKNVRQNIPDKEIELIHVHEIKLDCLHDDLNKLINQAGPCTFVMSEVYTFCSSLALSNLANNTSVNVCDLIEDDDQPNTIINGPVNVNGVVAQ